MYLQFNPVSMVLNGNTCANIGHTLMKEIECEIGGQRIDRQYAQWLTVWNELTTVNPTAQKAVIHTDGKEKQSGNCTLYDLMSYNHKGVNSATATTAAPSVATVPLQFWFNRNPGLALPLIALQYHEVKIKITFCDKSHIAADGGGTTTFPTQTQLWADYIYLDTDERRRFAQVSHEYLIEQLQVENGKSLNAATVDLNFNHPVKELIFAGAADTTLTGGTVGLAIPTLLSASSDGAGVETLQLKLNGHDRFSERNINYFTRTQVYQHHGGNGGVTVPDSVGVYSFALKPEEHQPSGTCNFSRIDSAQLKSTGNLGTVNVYAVNYNVLRIMSGMGGLAYSN
jgi:hypothetical protein